MQECLVNMFCLLTETDLHTTTVQLQQGRPGGSFSTVSGSSSYKIFYVNYSNTYSQEVNVGGGGNLKITRGKDFSIHLLIKNNTYAFH